MFRKTKRFLHIILCSLLIALCVNTTVLAYEPAEILLPVTTNEPMTIYIETEAGTPYRFFLINGTKKLEFTFDEPGTYGYFISQITDGSNENVNYDEHRWYVRITVEETKGILKPYYSISNADTKNKVNEILFTNTYGKIPRVPDTTVPTIPYEEPETKEYTPRSGVIEQILTVFIPDQEIRTVTVERLKDLFEEIEDLDTPLASFNAKTGDSMNRLPYILMMVVSGCTVITMLYLGRRRKGGCR